jgi:hypothetical protein
LYAATWTRASAWFRLISWRCRSRWRGKGRGQDDEEELCGWWWWGMTGALLLLGPRLFAGVCMEGVVRDDKTASTSKAKRYAAPPSLLYLQTNNTHHMPSVVDAEKESPRLLRTVALAAGPPTMGMADSC